MGRQKLLIVSWSIYPSPSGSSVIVDNIAGAFKDSEIVLIGEEITNIRLGDDKKRTKINYINPNIRVRGRGQKYFRWMNFGKLTHYIKDIAEKEKCTAILAIFPDEFYMYAAYKASHKLNLPFYTWFHNTYLDNRTGILKALAKRLQPRFFNHAQINFVMSDGMLKFYKEKYPNFSFQTLVHGFQIPDVVYRPFVLNDKTTRFLFSGSLNESCRDATVRQIKTIIQNPDYHVHLFTGNPPSDFEAYGIAGDNVHYEGFVSQDELVRRFSGFDIMLLPHGFDGKRTDVEYKTIFPTRTIPLLYSNRPILAHSPKNVFLTDFLRENDCAEIVDRKEPQAILDAIHKLKNDEKHCQKLVKNAFKTAKIFDVKEVSRKLKVSIATD